MKFVEWSIFQRFYDFWTKRIDFFALFELIYDILAFKAETCWFAVN